MHFGHTKVGVPVLYLGETAKEIGEITSKEIRARDENVNESLNDLPGKNSRGDFKGIEGIRSWETDKPREA